MSFIEEYREKYPHVWAELVRSFCDLNRIVVDGIGGVIYTTDIKTNQPVEVTGP